MRPAAAVRLAPRRGGFRAVGTHRRDALESGTKPSVAALHDKA